MSDFWRRVLAARTHRSPGYDPIQAKAVQMQTALGLLSDRYLQIADQATTDIARGRAVQIRQAGNDIRHTLITGRIPAYLMTDAELEQHGTPEETAS
ncbi:hypothetical protein ACFRFU_19390 [Streptomyces sp. NPDC056704]|uniref:hypothetical protein n=1 Tax=Streptomyces sp. NPDC056704 TaxID=3345917 RepID=UPI00368504B9